MLFWHFIGVCALASLWLLPAPLDAFVVHSTGCHHNGTWYADKSLVPTVENCLNCQCNKKTLVCRLKVCPEMPMPPPRGCVVVQKKNTCCPYMSCARLESFYKIPITRRIIQYLDHYERESIDRVVNDNMLQRRSDDSEVDTHVCVKNGTVYKSGSAMSSSNLCTYCYCIGGSEKCVKPKCMLPVEGCKPIFVDSTCCPVRYDCSSKPSGKSSQEVRYRKTSNKHFLRMSQRLQRNRGCSVGRQFYAEGQKMKSDADKPCDICFCIRGNRRCAPKKCSPALKNCIPVVPKGQCCPSSYDCGSQRDYRRAESSRQFNLFSLFFGKDEDGSGNATDIPEHYPHDRHPSVTAPESLHKHSPVGTSSEKSIFDTIREGLEFIDSNNDKLLEENLDLLSLETAGVPLKTEVVTSPPLKKETPSTEVSFLDLILGPSESAATKKAPTRVKPQQIPTETTTGSQELSWVDLLLGADDDEDKSAGSTTLTDKLDTTETTTNQQNEYSVGTTNIDRADENFDDYAGSGEILVGSALEQKEMVYSTTEQSTDGTTEPNAFRTSTENTDFTLVDDITTNTESTELEQKVESTTGMTDTTEKMSSNVQPTESPKLPNKTTITPTRQESPTMTRTTSTIPPDKTHTTTAITAQSTSTKATTKTPTKYTVKPVKKTNVPLQKKDDSPLLKQPQPFTKNESTQQPQKNNGLLTALLDGITDMLSMEMVQNKTLTKLKNDTTSKPTSPTLETTISQETITTTPMPLFKPLPSGKPHTRINSKITNITTNPAYFTNKHAPNTTFKPLPAELTKAPLITTPKPKASTTSTNEADTSTTSTTVKPVIIKMNPSILEAEPLDKNDSPTLPPSLPNLKIIPFLPTDAVEPDRNNYSKHPQTSRIDYDLYDEANLYPAITERFPTYPEEADDSKAEYIYKFKVEGPAPPVTSTSVKLNGSVGSTAFVNYDFDVVNGVPTNGFSPPTKTEGGFVPKEPFIIDDEDVDSDGLNYQVTKHIIDITTAEPMRENTKKIIEITTPDPFKDVIKTEIPPDLTSLIEDKENLLHAKEKLPIANKIYTQIPIVKPKPGNMHQKATDRPQGNLDFINTSNTKLTTPNKTANNNNVQDDRNTIESLLNLLFKDEDEELTSLQHVVATAPSKVPPFKTLPEATIQHMELTTAIPIKRTTTETKTTTTPTTTTFATTPTSRTTVKVTRNKIAATTTPRTKSKPKPVAPAFNLATKNGTTKGSTPTTKTTKTKIITTRRAATIKTTARAATTTTTPPASTINMRTTIGSTTTMRPTSITGHHTLLMSPFDKLPFMNTSYEIKTNPLPPPPHQSNEQNLLDLLDYTNSINRFEGLEPAYERYPAPFHSSSSTTTTTTTTTTTSAPQHSSLSAQYSAKNSLIDPTGILKLAGCNIYGRMYRVGRIIVELSNPCLECKCTEIGVKCGPLDC